MIIAVAAAILACAQGQADLPRYTAQALWSLSNTNPGIEKINARGDFSFGRGFLGSGLVLSGERFDLPVFGQDWFCDSVYDLNDSGIAFGVYGNGGSPGKGIFIGRGDNVRRVPLENHRPIATPALGFINARGDAVFNVHQRLVSHGPTFAVKFDQSSIRLLPYSQAGAHGSAVYHQSEAGDMCGELVYGVIAKNGSLRETRKRAAIWNREGELTVLRDPEGSATCWAVAIHSKDLVSGISIDHGRRTTEILWKRGEPKPIVAPGDARGAAGFFTPDGRLIAGLAVGRAQTVSTQIGDTWHTLVSLTTNLPRGVSFDRLIDVASDGSILVADETGTRQFTYYRLKPVPSE